MTTVESNAVATDQPVEKTRPERIKFKLEMMALMIMAGRQAEASQLLGEAFDLLDQMIEEDVQ